MPINHGVAITSDISQTKERKTLIAVSVMPASVVLTHSLSDFHTRGNYNNAVKILLPDQS